MGVLLYYTQSHILSTKGDYIPPAFLPKAWIDLEGWSDADQGRICEAFTNSLNFMYYSLNSLNGLHRGYIGFRV